MPSTRSMTMRVAAAAGSLALTLSIVAAPAVMAQDDDPKTTITGLIAAIEAKDLEAVPGYFCDEFAGTMGGFDLTGISEGMPPGLDAEMLLDAFVLDVEIESLEVLSQTDEQATLDLIASMSMSIDEEALPPFIEALLTSMGQEPTPDMVDMFSGVLMSEFETEATDISTQITLVPGETMPWLVCSDLGAIDGAEGEVMDDAEASAEATEGE